MKQMIESFKTFINLRKKKKNKTKPTVVKTALTGGAYYYQAVAPDVDSSVGGGE